MVRAVMVGCGAISDTWLTAIRDTPALTGSLDLVGFVDLDPARAAAQAAGFGWAEATCGSDPATLLADLAPDVVFDLVVPEARGGIVALALDRGCHVLSEKPMATSMAEARDLVARAAKAGRHHAVIQNRRFLPGIRRARAFLGSGAIGDLTAVHCDFFKGAHFGGFRDAMDHPLLVDMAIHTFDAARYLTGRDATAVYCREANPQGSWYAQGASADALFDLEGGVTMTYRGSWCAEGAPTSWETGWRVIGTRGTLIWDGNEGFEATRVAADEGFLRPLETVALPPLAEPLVEGHAGVIHDFVSAVRDGRPPLTAGTDNIRSLAMVMAAVQSAGAGVRVPVEGLEANHA